MTLGRMFEKQDSPTAVFLARHGESIWNVERRFQGVGDSPLSERGLEQARRVGRRLAGLDGTKSEAKGTA